MDFKNQSKILITCGPSLSSYLEQEIIQLGHTPVSSGSTYVMIKGSLTDTMILNLHLRTAYNVLFELKEFKCNSPNELYREAKSIPWEDIILPDEYLSVVSKVDTPSIDNTMFSSLKTKDAIVDRIQEKLGQRPDSGPDRNNVVIYLYWRKDHAWIYINTSGQKLSDRGYRKIPHKAPLRETLAASIIMETGYKGEEPFIAPMCGSGTLAIEAALIALERAPGLLRSNYGFTHLKGFDAETWKSLRNEIRRKSRRQFPAPIIATDIDVNAVEAARKNATTAGVDQLIQFDVCDFAETKLPGDKGIIVMNPEYGYRVGKEKELESTYQRIGDFFKQKCAGYTGFIFTGNLNLAKRVGLKTNGRIIFQNGNIECRLLRYELYTGSKKIFTPRDSG